MNRNKFVVAGLLTVGLAFAASQLVAQGDGDLHKVVLKLGADIKAGKTPKIADAAKAADLEEWMHTMKPSKNKGLKIGSIDGIEKALQTISRDGPSKAQIAGAKDLEEVGYILQGLGQVFEALPTSKGKKEKAWKGFTDAMVDGGKKLSVAAKGGNGADIQAAAKVANQACVGCHSKYK